MEENKENSDIRFDDELGIHHAGGGIKNNEVKERYNFEVETEPVFKRLAEDIYKGSEAGIREPLTNSVTSIIRATEEGYIENPDEGVIVIELYEEDNAGRLTLRDNGLGITRDELDKVVTQIGKSTSKSSEELTGKFGMGFLATWMLTGGTDGGFGMYSNPRGVDEGPFFGFWDSEGFSEMEPPKSSFAGLSEDEYGVEFEIFLGQSISTDDVVSWIDKYCEWTRVPVMFRHHKEDGVKDEEYPSKRLIDKYENIQNGRSPDELGYKIKGEELQYYKIETDFFTAINSNLVEESTSRLSGAFRGSSNHINKCVLMDVPIKPDWNTRNFPLYSLEIRLKYETPVVVEGPHKGCFVSTGNEKQESLGDNYISYESLTDEDFVTPFPTGTRDHVQDNSGFIDWIRKKFEKMYYEDVAGNFPDISTIEEYCNLSDNEVEKVGDIIREISGSRMINRPDIEDVENFKQTSFNSELKRALPIMKNQSCSYAEEETKGVSRRNNRINVRLDKIVRDTYNNDDKRVFMAHRITQEKAEFVWASENKHYVVYVPSKRQQDYEDLFGWEKLGDLDFENDLKMKDEKRQKFTSNNQSVSEKLLTLHIGSYSKTKKVKSEVLKENIKNKESTITDNKGEAYNMKKLVLFHRNRDNISHNKNIVGNTIGTVSVGTEVYDYLKDTQNVWTTDTIEEGININISDGSQIDLKEGDFPENAVYHVIDERAVESFRDDETMKNIQNWIRNNTDAPDDAVYVPITHTEKDFASVSTNNYRNFSINTREEEYGSSHSSKDINLNSEVELYVRAIINKNSPAYEALKTVQAEWSEGGKELVEKIEK